ncbi:MAG TPA: histidine kinase dimerization/phospho-acceptor domain-containing protein [Candidatus Sulfotelmatobacter sp.]|nr:histidine kinase dimerization/phospho-acceptor domain-containing protein [Candidatus Sulfotelmatobacter sp.]
MNNRSKLWSGVVIFCLAAAVIGALTLPQSYGLTAVSDVTQCILLGVGTFSLVPRALRSPGRLRLFWTMLAAGMALWFIYQLIWTYFEVFLRRDVPDLFDADIIIFLHFVPLMAALGLRAHIGGDEYSARLGRLDFTLLLVWWIYVYVFIVTPWLYAVPDAVPYAHNLNALYLAEKVAFLVALAVSWKSSKGSWRTLYANLFGFSLLYASSSYVANWALERRVYYSGSLYDIPLSISGAWIAWVGLWSTAGEPEGESKAATAYGVWVARCGMIAVFSLPIFAAWTLSDMAVPHRILSFRLVLTLLAALAMGVMVFVRQYLLDRELVNLYHHSQESIENLKRLQAQILQSEKLASIGQLVGGAAHELNNPLTAMLGYSDLLLSTELNPEQRLQAVKIGQHVRRTRSLVASLLSFARHTPVARTPIDLNTLVRTAVKLAESQWQPLKIEVRAELDSQLPRVLGDSNQLLQVCSQVLGNALHALEGTGGRKLRISTTQQNDMAVLQVFVDGNGQTEDDDGRLLGLSACQGIVQEHRGRIRFEQGNQGELTVSVELPVVSSPLQAAMRTTPQPA